MYKTYRFVKPESIKVGPNPKATESEYEKFTTNNLDLQRAIDSGKITTISNARLFNMHRSEEMRRGFVIQEGYGLDLVKNEYARNQKTEPRYFVLNGEKFYPLVKKPQRLLEFEAKLYPNLIIKVYDSNFNFAFNALYVDIDENSKSIDISEVLKKSYTDRELAEASSIRPIQGWTKDNQPIFENGLTNSDPDPYLQDGPVKKLINFVNTELDSFSVWDYEEKLDQLSDEELDVFIERLSNVLV